MIGSQGSRVDDDAFVDVLVQTSHDLVCVLDRDGTIVRFNRACEEATGWTAVEVVGTDARATVIPPDEAEAFGEFLEEVWRTGLPSPQIGHWMTRDGRRFPVAWANRPLFDDAGRPTHVVTAGNNLTERLRTAEALRTLAAEQGALRRVATAVARGDAAEEIFEAVSREAGGVVGAEAAEIFRFESADLADAESAVARVRATGRPARFEDTVAAPIFVSGALWGALAVTSTNALPPETEDRLHEFTELVSLALASADAREQLLESRRRLVQASDAERKRLERNLHDGAQQRLVSLGIAIRLARAKVEVDPGTAAQLLDSACDDLEAAVKELRELARGLHPAILTDHGLRPALSLLAARSPFPVEIELTEERFPEEVEAALYYVISEALTNVAKHANAQRARVAVRQLDDHAVCEIADDGAGGASIAAGTGLRGLRDRVEALRGRLELHSEAETGTRLRAELPLS
jgi:PAS domain S-box-containing protein